MRRRFYLRAGHFNLCWQQPIRPVGAQIGHSQRSIDKTAGPAGSLGASKLAARFGPADQTKAAIATLSNQLAAVMDLDQPRQLQQQQLESPKRPSAAPGAAVARLGAWAGSIDKFRPRFERLARFDLGGSTWARANSALVLCELCLQKPAGGRYRLVGQFRASRPARSRTICIFGARRRRDWPNRLEQAQFGTSSNPKRLDSSRNEPAGELAARAGRSWPKLTKADQS